MLSARANITHDVFQVAVSNMSGWLDVGPAIAAARCGALGVLNFEFITNSANSRQAIDRAVRLTRRAPGRLALRLQPDVPGMRDLLNVLPESFTTVILIAVEGSDADSLAEAVKQAGTRDVYVEVTNVVQARQASAFAIRGLIAKGHEAGGFVGEESTFVLLQRLLTETSLPVWAFGGVGLHSAAACLAGGASGVLLDSQASLTPESFLPAGVQAQLRRFTGDETICLGRDLGLLFRTPRRQCLAGVEYLQALEPSLRNLPREEARKRWRAEIARMAGFGQAAHAVWPIGQDASFAGGLTKQHGNIAGIVEAIRTNAATHVRLAQKQKIFAPGSALATDHGIRYPIFQGPMTRVSDTPEFAHAVAEAGALPFLALALLRGPETTRLLTETAQRLGDLPWGVGILGFVPPELRAEQLEAVSVIRPKFAIIAGGRPDQARMLETRGICTYLHVPAPGLLQSFLEDGARHFIFEGRECGGHVGPRTSLVLWETMTDVLLEAIEKGGVAGPDLKVVFAGGIHDDRSAAMVAALAAPLVERGVKVAVLMGTAYVFTTEAVSAGAIVETFQLQAVQCERTVVLESGPGHATRCIDTPFADTFVETRRGLLSTGRQADEIRETLENLSVGRLRTASKGIERAPGQNGDGVRYIQVAAENQLREGMYMIGQVAALRNTVCTMRELHDNVASGSVRFLSGVQIADAPATDTSRWAQTPCDIAIVGISCRLPGASNHDQLWSNILGSKDALEDIRAERFDSDIYFDSDTAAPDRIYSRRGGFLDNTGFDPLRYGIPPTALSSIDPLQLLMLAAVDEALDDAGFRSRRFPRERTSVIFGFSGGLGEMGVNYAVRATLPQFAQTPPELFERLPVWTEDSFAGLLPNVGAGRVANRFDLGGVNFTVDAACASSLAAVYVAARELVNGDSDVVITGGVDTGQNPFGYLCFSKSRALSPRGQCSTFDESADGTSISEGISVLVLKRLSDAERDGDRIYAVIKGIAGSSDGRGRSMTAPRPEGQILALQRAYAQANVSPASVSLVEAHGTGTVAGDAAELTALTEVFRADGAEPETCAVGSIKSMLGHTKAAAGVSGLIKVALSLYRRVLPPTLHVEKPSRQLLAAHTPFYVNIEAQPWPASGSSRRAGVSAFGFGGTNFHAVVEEYGDSVDDADGRPCAPDWPWELFQWSAPAVETLGQYLRQTAVNLKGAGATRLADLAHAVWEAYGVHQSDGARAAIVAASLEELTAKIETAIRALSEGKENFRDPQNGIFLSKSGEAGKLAFVFPGQGSQSVLMLRDLAIRFPEFQESLSQARGLLKDLYPKPLDAYIYPPAAFTEEAKQKQSEALTDTAVAQPALGAVEIAAHKLLLRLGVKPDMTAGHSYGEYVALWAASVIDEESLLRLSAARGLCIRDMTGSDPGSMAAVSAPAQIVSRIIDRFPGVVIANQNAPKQTVIAGSTKSVNAATAELEAAHLTVRRIPVACAFHSPLMTPASERLADALAQESFRTPVTPVFSNTIAAQFPDSPWEIREILQRHLTSCVEFVREVEAMYDAGARIFLEVGPRGVVSALLRQILAGKPAQILQIDSSQTAGMKQFLQTLAHLASVGVTLNASELFRGRVRETLDIRRPLPAKADPEWLLNPSRIWKKGDRPAPPERLHLVTSTASGLTTGAPASWTAGTTSSVPAPVTSQDGAADAVMLQFQKLMSQFLQTQAGVMSAYLQGGQTGVIPTPELVQSLPLVSPAPIAPVVSVGIPAAVAATVRSRNIADEFVQTVSRRTGYPVEMLGLDSGLESDLGIDSIKRMEVLAEYRAQCHPEEQTAIRSAMDRLTAAKTLRGIIEHLECAAGSRLHVSSATADAENAVIEPLALLLTVTSERTGYPAEILSKDAAIEADLGIDSIKRTEIVAEFRKRCAPDYQERVRNVMDKLLTARTLQLMADCVVGMPASETLPTPRAAADVPCFRLITVDDPAESLRPAAAVPGRISLITDDETGLAEDVASELAASGERPVLLRHSFGGAIPAEGVYITDLTDPAAVDTAVQHVRTTCGDPACVIHLLPLRASEPVLEGTPEDWRRNVRMDVRSLYALARSVGSSFESGPEPHVRPMLIAVTARGGHFGLHGDHSSNPIHQGAADLMKTCAAEFDRTVCRVVDVDPKDSRTTLCRKLMNEILSDECALQTGLPGERRVTAVPAPASQDHPLSLMLDRESVILLTGGARGITAAIAQTLARRYRSTLIIAGHTPYPEHNDFPDYVRSGDAVAGKAGLLAKMQAMGVTPKPAEVEREWQRLGKEYEIVSNISALRSTGARVEYHQVDVRDDVAFGELIDSVYRNHNRLDVLVHGAGVIEDKLIRDKTAASFDRVVHTKADSAFVIARRVRWDSVGRVVFMSSISAAFGNRGQGDYAAANGIMNGIALALASEYPGRVAALNFGPWDRTGMVSEAVRQQFEERGIQLIGVEEGVGIVLNAVERGTGSSPILIAGDGPWSRIALEHQSRAVGSSV